MTSRVEDYALIGDCEPSRRLWAATARWIGCSTTGLT